MNEQTPKRRADYPIDEIYLERWSSRAFSNKEVEEEKLFSLFEAARWAPSASNIQPWRFIYAQTEEDRKRFLTFINDGNVTWCKEAPVLVAVVAHMHFDEESDDINPTHAFDAGTAWGFLSLEAIRKGLMTHAMGGFNRKKAKEVLHIPDNYTVLAIVAVGYKGDQATLPEALQKREVPSNRKKVNTFVYEGLFDS